MQGLRAGLGLHPSCVEEYHLEKQKDSGYGLERSEDSLDRLGRLLYSELAVLLRRYPQVMIGEFGLDRSLLKKAKEINDKLHRSTQLERNHTRFASITWSWQCQLVSFETQMRLAHEYNRPASIRVVNAYGYFEKYVKSRLSLVSTSQVVEGLPPKIVLNSYSGGPQMVDHLSKLCEHNGTHLYFGFSNGVNIKRYGSHAGVDKRLHEVIASIPDDRILVESNSCIVAMESQLYFEDWKRVQDDLIEVIYVISVVKGWTAEETILKTAENASKFYCTEMTVFAK